MQLPFTDVFPEVCAWRNRCRSKYLELVNFSIFDFFYQTTVKVASALRLINKRIVATYCYVLYNVCLISRRPYSFQHPAFSFLTGEPRIKNAATVYCHFHLHFRCAFGLCNAQLIINQNICLNGKTKCNTTLSCVIGTVICDLVLL